MPTHYRGMRESCVSDNSQEVEKLFHFAKDGEGLSLEAFERLLIRFMKAGWVALLGVPNPSEEVETPQNPQVTQVFRKVLRATPVTQNLAITTGEV